MYVYLFINLNPVCYFIYIVIEPKTSNELKYCIRIKPLVNRIQFRNKILDAVKKFFFGCWPCMALWREKWPKMAQLFAMAQNGT